MHERDFAEARGDFEGVENGEFVFVSKIVHPPFYMEFLENGDPISDFF
jgi:hypothetical protein